jgi:hypothetical protein
LARILDSEKAETFGSLEKVVSTFGVGVTEFTEVSTVGAGVSAIFSQEGTEETLFCSTIE